MKTPNQVSCQTDRRGAIQLKNALYKQISQKIFFRNEMTQKKRKSKNDVFVLYRHYISFYLNKMMEMGLKIETWNSSETVYFLEILRAVVVSHLHKAFAIIYSFVTSSRCCSAILLTRGCKNQIPIGKNKTKKKSPMYSPTPTSRLFSMLRNDFPGNDMK